MSTKPQRTTSDYVRLGLEVKRYCYKIAFSSPTVGRRQWHAGFKCNINMLLNNILMVLVKNEKRSVPRMHPCASAMSAERIFLKRYRKLVPRDGARTTVTTRHDCWRDSSGDLQRQRVKLEQRKKLRSTLLMGKGSLWVCPPCKNVSRTCEFLTSRQTFPTVPGTMDPVTSSHQPPK